MAEGVLQRAIPDMVPENKGAIMSLIQSRRWEIFRATACSHAVAYEQAVTDIAAMLRPPVTRAELQQFVRPYPHHTGQRKTQVKKAAFDTRTYSTASAEDANMVEAPASRATRLNNALLIAYNLTRDWLMVDAVLPKAGALGFFTSIHYSNFDKARRRLQEEGWEFADMGTHWKAKRPQSPDEIEFNRLQVEIAERNRRLAELKTKLGR